MTSLHVLIFFYQGGPPLLHGCASRARGNVSGACMERDGGLGVASWGPGAMGRRRWEGQDIEVALPKVPAAPWSISPRDGKGLTLEQLA